MLKKLALIGLTMSIAFATGVCAKPSLAPTVSQVMPADSQSMPPADKIVVITSKTKSVNVFEDSAVLFKVGDKAFVVKFDGNNVMYNLRTLAPNGVVTHNVKIFVAPNPKDHEQGIP